MPNSNHALCQLSTCSYNRPSLLLGPHRRTRQEQRNSKPAREGKSLLITVAMLAALLFAIVMLFEIGTPPVLRERVLNSAPAAAIVGVATVLVIPLLLWLIGDDLRKKLKNAVQSSLHQLKMAQFVICWAVLTGLVIITGVFVLEPWSISAIHSARNDLPDVATPRPDGSFEPHRNIYDAYRYTLQRRNSPYGRSSDSEYLLVRTSRQSWFVPRRITSHLGLANIAALEQDQERAAHHLDRAALEASWYSCFGARSLYKLVLQEAITLFLQMALKEQDINQKHVLLQTSNRYIGHWKDLPLSQRVEGFHLRQLRAAIMYETGDYVRAETAWIDLIREIREYHRRHHSPRGNSHAVLADALNNLAVLRMRQQRFDNAKQRLEEALRVPDGELNRTKLNLAWCLAKLRSYDKAAEIMLDLFGLDESHLPAEHALIAAVTLDPTKRLQHIGRALGRDVRSFGELTDHDRTYLVRVLQESYPGLPVEERDFTYATNETTSATYEQGHLNNRLSGWHSSECERDEPLKQ